MHDNNIILNTDNIIDKISKGNIIRIHNSHLNSVKYHLNKVFFKWKLYCYSSDEYDLLNEHLPNNLLDYKSTINLNILNL